MADIILFGAGASVDAGLPGSFGLTSAISKARSLPEPGDKWAEDLALALAFAIGTLYQRRGAEGINPLRESGIDIEELVEAVDALAHPESSGATAFVSGWHPFLRDVDAAQHDRGRMVDFFVETISAMNSLTGGPAKEARAHASASLKVALQLSQSRFAAVLFQRLKKSLVLRLSQLLWLNPEDVDRTRYLRSLLIAPSTRCIATLNYDNTVENCASAAGIALETGLESYSETGTVQFSSKAKVHLLKLHGSVDWLIPDSSGREGDHPGKRALRFAWSRVDPKEKAWSVDDVGIVLGKRKLETTGPFSDLLQHFVGELSGADRLIVVGYSFRDNHINRAIAQFLMRRPHGKLLIVDPALPDDYQVLVELISRFTGRVRVWNVSAREAFETHPDSLAEQWLKFAD